MDSSGKNTSDPEYSHLDADMTNTASSADLTGLIPSAPRSGAELNSYKDIYNFGNEAGKTGKEKGK